MTIAADLPLVLPASPRDGWAEAMFGHAHLGDARRTRRVVRLVTDLAAQPSASIPTACGDAASTKAAYRFFDLTTQATAAHLPEQILAAQAAATHAQLAGERRVLAVQDTTNLDWTHHPATVGLGHLDHPRHRGLLAHTTLAVRTDGVPLGLLAQQTWARDPDAVGQKHQRRQRPTAAKESQKWLTALAASRADLPAGVTLIHVGDREADVYDLFRAAQDLPHTALLIRATGDRCIAEVTGRVCAHLAAQPVADTRTVPIPRAGDRAARDAHLTLRWARVTLLPPQHRAGERLPPIPVDAVWVTESAAPDGEPPISWLLLTTVPVTTAEEAWERVTWYTYRWRIERFHLILKSGCRIEARQLATQARLACCLAVLDAVAVRLLHLTYWARATPDAPATALLDPDEWPVLWAARHPQTPVPPPGAPTLRQAVREIAGLGGFLGRRGDGEPGVITLWRGLTRLHDLLTGYHLAKALVNHDVGNG